jgi:hypothetical protein
LQMRQGPDEWLIAGRAVGTGPGLVFRILLPIAREGETDTEGDFISPAASGRGKSLIPASHNDYVSRRCDLTQRQGFHRQRPQQVAEYLP